MKFSTRSSRRGRVADAAQHDLQRHAARLVLALDALPLEEPLPVRRERADAALGAVGGDQERVVPEQLRDAFAVLVAGEVLVERLLAGTPGFFSSTTTSGRPLTKPTVGAAGVERAGDADLADEQEVVRLRVRPVDDPHALGLLAAVLVVRHRDGMPSLSRP